VSKVFGIGFHKTGTSTLHSMLKTLGYKVCPPNKGYRHIKFWHSGDYGPIIKLASKYNGFQDSPWCHPDMYKVLERAFPESKFILTIREPEDWFVSFYKNYSRLCHPTGKFNYKKYAKWDGRMYYDKIFGFIPNHYDDLLKNKYDIINVYSGYNESVKNYFSKDKLLVINWQAGDGWRDICIFLNKDIITGPIPWVKKSKGLK